MKKILVVILVLSGAVLGLTSCGTTGVDGLVFLSVDWDGYLDYFYDTALPGTFYANTYYEVNPGSYVLYYRLDDGLNYYPSGSTVYEVDYSVQSDPGTTGLFPGMAGTDGLDNYYSLYLSWYEFSISGPANTVKTVLDIPGYDYSTQIKGNGKIVTVSIKKVDQPPAGVIPNTVVK